MSSPLQFACELQPVLSSTVLTVCLTASGAFGNNLLFTVVLANVNATGNDTLGLVFSCGRLLQFP